MGLSNTNLNISSQASSISPAKKIGGGTSLIQLGSPSLSAGIASAVTSFVMSDEPFAFGPVPPWGPSKKKIIPIAKKSSPKSSTISGANGTGNESLATKSAKDETGQASKTNQELAIDETRVEPIAVFNLRTTDLRGDPLSPLQAAVVQSYLEDRISQEFATAIFEKMLSTNPDTFKQIDGKLSQQIGDVQRVIDQLWAIFKTLRLVNASMSPKLEKESVSLIATQVINSLCKVEPLLTQSERLVDPLSLIGFFGPQGAEDPLKSRTAMIAQVLQIAAQSLFRGYTPRVLGEHLLDVRPGMFSVATGKSSYLADVKTLSLKNVPTQNHVYGLGNEVPYVGLDFYKKLQMSANKRSLALVTMLANEYALSAGLGRLSETPLGNRFGSNSKNYIETFLGTQGTQDASQETTNPESLVDYFVIAQDGSPQTQEKNRVLLLDGNDALSGQENAKVNSSFNEFMTSITRSPLTNRMKLFDDAIIRADTSINEGLQFYKKLHLRDQDPVLLTPRGLYTRLLDEISAVMSQLSAGKNRGKKLEIVELGVLREIAKQGKNVIGKDTAANVIKRYLLSLMAKKAALKLSGKDYTQFKSDADSGKNSQQSTTTNVKVTEGGKSKTYTIETSQPDPSSGKGASSASFSDDVIRISPDDGKLIGEKMENAVNLEVYVKMLELGTTNTALPKGDSVTIKMGTTGFFEQIYESDSSLLSRIVGVFIDMHEEAKKFSKLENGDATWLGTNRLTLSSQIDGTLSISMLFEAVLDLVSMFVDAEVRKSLSGKFSVIAAVGSDSQNSLAYRAIKLLAQGSKSNDFRQLLSDSELLPDLDNLPLGIVVTAQSNADEKSFYSLQQNFVSLAEERDVPLTALASASALVSYTKQQTKNLSNLAAMLRGEKEPSDLAKSFRSFAQEQLGKEFLASVTDYSLEIAQSRLNDVKDSMIRPSKKVEKLTEGEMLCIKQIIKEKGNSQTDNLIFCSVGLPGDFVSSNHLLTKFSLSNGYGADADDQLLQLSISQDGVFDNASYSQFSKKFFVTRQIGRQSFSGFEQNPPVSQDDIVNRMTLLNGKTGKDYIDSHKKVETAKNVLINEMVSYLMKKALSLMSSVDMTEENLTKIDYGKRAAGAKDLARTISETAGLPSKTFDSVFLADGEHMRLSETEMLKITVPHEKKTIDGQISEPPLVDLGTAELFYDIFDSPYFYDGLIRERVFSPTYFDKVLGVFFSSSPLDFKKISDGKLEIIKGGKKIDTDDAKAMAKVASDPTQGSVSIMTYSAKVESATPVT